MLGARANRFQIPGQLAIVVCYVEPHTNVILFGSLSRGIAVSRSLESQVRAQFLAYKLIMRRTVERFKRIRREKENAI